MSAHLKHILWKAALLTTVVSLVGVTVALAVSGDLDNTFGGGDGKVITDFFGTDEGFINAVAIQPDGAIVAVGYSRLIGESQRDLALVRYEADGDPDATFDDDGILLLPAGSGNWQEGSAVSIDDNGMIVVAGRICDGSVTACELIVWRFESDGDMDPAFNGGAPRVVSFGGHDSGSLGGLAIDSTGRIVVAGYLRAANKDFAVYRLNANGTPDTSFSGDGMQRVGFGKKRQDEARDLALQGAKIVVAGSSCTLAGVCNFALARLKSTGSLDKKFSGDGKVTTDFGAREDAYAVAINASGKIVAAGSQSTSNRIKMAVARYNTNGGLDTSFSVDGKQTVAISTYAWTGDMAVEASGKIVLAGRGSNGITRDYAVVRLTPEGALDSTFSADGKVLVDFNPEEEYAYGLALDDDGKYVVGGVTYTTPPHFALARIMP